MQVKTKWMFGRTKKLYWVLFWAIRNKAQPMRHSVINEVETILIKKGWDYRTKNMKKLRLGLEKGKTKKLKKACERRTRIKQISTKKKWIEHIIIAFPLSIVVCPTCCIWSFRPKKKRGRKLMGRFIPPLFFWKKNICTFYYK